MTFSDKLVSLVLILASFIAIVFQGFTVSDERDKIINIFVDGELYGSYEFEEKTIEVKSEYGENTVKINNEKVWVSKASCPDKFDVKSEGISNAGQMIICLPNRVLIEISGKNKKVDKVSY